MTPQAAPAASSSFYLAMRILPQAQARGDVRALRLLPRGRRHRRRAGRLDARRSAWRNWSAGAPTSPRSSPGGRRRAWPGSTRRVRRFGLRRRGIPRRDRRHGDGRGRRHPRPGLGDAGSLLRPGGERGRAAVGAHLRPRAEPGEALAHHLGRALQLTNILRDIDEDAAIGRLYLPREALAAAAVTTDEPLAAAADPRLAVACVEVAARARRHFDAALPIMATRAAGGGAGAAADGRRLSLDPRQDGRRGFRAAAAAREGEPAARSRRPSALRRSMSGRRRPCRSGPASPA